MFPRHALSCPGPYGPNTQAHAASTKRGYVYMLSLFPGFPLRMDELARTCEDLSIRGCVRPPLTPVSMCLLQDLPGIFSRVLVACH